MKNNYIITYNNYNWPISIYFSVQNVFIPIKMITELLNNWFFMAILGVFFLSNVAILDKYITRKIKQEKIISVFRFLLSAIFAFILLFIFEKKINIFESFNIYFLIPGFFYAIAAIGYFLGMKYFQISKFSVIFVFGSTMLTFLGEILLFEKKFSIILFSGIIFMVIGLFIFNNKKFMDLKDISPRGILLLSIWFTFYSFFALSSKAISFNKSPLILNFWQYLIVTIILFIIYRNNFTFKNIREFNQKIKTDYYVIMTSSLFGALGNFCFLQALKYGLASKVVTISSLQPLFVVIISRYMFKEEDILKKTIGVAIIIIGVIIIRIY